MPSDPWRERSTEVPDGRWRAVIGVLLLWLAIGGVVGVFWSVSKWREHEWARQEQQAQERQAAESALQQQQQAAENARWQQAQEAKAEQQAAENARWEQAQERFRRVVEAQQVRERARWAAQNTQIGMCAKKFRCLWGAPDRRQVFRNEYGSTEYWYYGSQVQIKVEDDRVTAINKY